MTTRNAWSVTKCRWLWMLQVVLGCGLLVNLCQSQGLSVIGPKLIRSNSNYTVVLANSLLRNVRLEVQLEGTTDGETVLNEITVLSISRKNGKSATFQVGLISEGEYTLSVKSLDKDFSFNEDIALTYESKTESVFVQLDKPVYKPGDMIRFRVVVVDVNTRPVTNIKTVQVNLADANGDSIRQWPFGKLYNGVFESAVPLASSPVLGNWTLTVEAGNNKVVKQIELREYVLPKYSVEVYPTDVLLISKKQISLTIESMYTFGKPLYGTVTVDVFFGEIVRKPDLSATKPIEGRTTVDFSIADELEVEPEAEASLITVRVSVMETFTNQTQTIVKQIPVFLQPYTITVVKSEPMFRPGIRYPIQIVLKDRNGIPPKDGKNADIIAHYDGEDLEEDVTYDEVPDDRGIIFLDLKPPSNANLLQLKVTYDEVEYENLEEIHAAQSKSNQFITISLNSKKYPIVADRKVVFEVSCTEPMTHFSFIIVARGSIIDSGFVSVFKKKTAPLTYKLLPQMSPKAKIIVSYTNSKYLLFDEMDLEFDVFNNDFNFDLDHDADVDYEPGQEIYIELKAAKDSYVAFHAIDQSVLLLGRDGHDFTKNDVLQELALYGYTESTEFDSFNNMGLFLRTSVQVDFPYSRNQHLRFGGHSFGDQNARTRIQFSETWLWKDFTMNGRSTKQTIEDEVPDSITSWYVSGFALSPTLGLGIMSEPRKFTVKQPFYIVANLPYSIKRDEIVLVQVTVFNFLGSTLTSDVTLFNKNDEIEFVEKASTNNTYRTKAIIVPDNNGKPISFMIKAKKLGEIAIKLQAVNQLKTDVLEHMLRVTPESHQHVKNEARFIELPKPGVNKYDIPLPIPTDIDEGSVNIKFTLDPDILGKAIENLNSLIRQPSGCGEQNMINFVPNMVVLDYFTETGTGSEANKQKAMGYLRSGYQNQLRYKQSDGSFGIWPTSGGSVFLTSFVAKSLKIADKHMSVDLSVVDNAFRWLANAQKPNGRFDEIGPIYHADMQGGLRSTNYALTAYVLAAFLETESVARNHQYAVQRSVDYLVSNFNNINHPYDLALSTYALSLRKHADRRKFLDKLVETSVGGANSSEQMRRWDSGSLSIEIAGYALLSYVEQGLIIAGSPVMRWMNTQRYDRGGFPGTQDTFVGLKALSKYAAKTSSRNNAYRVTIRPKAGKLHTFDVDSTTTNLQQLEIDSRTRKMDIEISGVGNGFFQVAYQYYQNIVNEKPSFNLVVNVMNASTYYQQHLSVCVNYVPKESYQLSNMATVEIALPSGFVGDTDSVKDKSNAISKVEPRFGGTSLVVYYSNVGVRPYCFDVITDRMFKVAMHRPSHVVVYDYYERTRFAIKTYEGMVMQLCDICEEEDCETLACEKSA